MNGRPSQRRTLHELQQCARRVAKRIRVPRGAGIAIAVIATLAIPGCSHTMAPAGPATVYFVLEAPLCSSIIPVRFAIDGYAVGVDTFRVNLPNAHVKSARSPPRLALMR